MHSSVVGLHLTTLSTSVLSFCNGMFGLLRGLHYSLLLSIRWGPGAGKTEVNKQQDAVAYVLLQHRGQGVTWFQLVIGLVQVTGDFQPSILCLPGH